MSRQFPENFQVDFVTTACNRSEILNDTYHSLSLCLKDLDLKKCTLYLNIDPMPNADNIEDNVVIAQQYFGQVIYHIPHDPTTGQIAAKGNVSRAFKWCVDQVKKPYTFYLEDDWRFVQEFHMMKLISMIKMIHPIASINLYKIDGGRSNSNRIYLSPSLFKTSHLKRINNLLLPDYSPEKQLRPMHPINNPYPYGGRILKMLKYHGICYKKNNNYPMVIDLGRSWMQHYGLKKTAGINGTFLTWAVPTQLKQSSPSTAKVLTSNSSNNVHIITMKSDYRVVNVSDHHLINNVSNHHTIDDNVDDDTDLITVED